jgi:hypothetical protein
MTRAEMRRKLKQIHKLATLEAKQAAKQNMIRRILERGLGGKRTLKSYVLEFLLDRKENGYAEKMNLDDIWYHLRQTKFDKDKIEINKYSRKNVKGYVQELCDLLELRRDNLGIIAQAYATMYFRGRLYNIAIDGLAGLKNLGAFVLIIEKEGIVEVLKPYADRYGVALVTSHGFLTENAADLSGLIKRVGVGKGNVAILTDFDISGLLIALNIPDIPRIGVDFDTLRDLGYNPDDEDVRREFEEAYTPVKNHWDAVTDEHRRKVMLYPPSYRELLSDANLVYLKEKRIEINAVKTAVGAERLWKFIMHKLHTTFPECDYNRAIDVDGIAEITPKPLLKLNRVFASKVANTLGNSVMDYKLKLRYYNGDANIFDDENDDINNREKRDDYGFLEIEPCVEKMYDDFARQLEKDKQLKPVLKAIDVLADKLGGTDY